MMKKKLRRYLPEIYGFLSGLNQTKARSNRKINLMRRGIRFRRELLWEEDGLLVKNDVRYKEEHNIIFRENIRIPRYENKIYKLVPDEQNIVSIDRNTNFKYNHLTKLSLIEEEKPVLTFIFFEPAAIRVIGKEEENSFRDMNAWGLAIEMSMCNRSMKYYINFKEE